MKTNPKVEIIGTFGRQWIRLEAISVLDDRLEAKQHMLDSYPMLQSMYQADDGNTEVFWLKDATATIFSFTEEPKTYTSDPEASHDDEDHSDQPGFREVIFGGRQPRDRRGCRHARLNEAHPECDEG